MKSINIILGLFILGFSSGCHKDSHNDENETPRIKNYSKIVSPETNSKVVIGDIITFEIGSEKSIDSITLDYGNEYQVFTNNKFSWDSKSARTGYQRVKISVYQKDLPIETHYPRLLFLSDKTPETYSYRVTNSFPHSKKAYTQGYFFKDDTLYESTGQPAGYDLTSYIAKVNLKTGENYQFTPLGSKYFGEGSTYWNEKIIMLTWKSNTGFVFDGNLQQTGTFQYTHEGWGITTMGDTLIVSDGTENLHLLNPRDFSEFDKLQVYDAEGKVEELNELEMIDGLLYANIYLENTIIGIDPKTGKVLREIDMSGLLSGDETSGTDVLNGIAYNPNNGKIYVTGKLWPKAFEVVFEKK